MATTYGVGQFSDILAITGTDLATYVDNQVMLETHGAQYITFYINYTKGGEDGAKVRFEVSPDGGTTWYILPYNEGTWAEWTDTATAKERFRVQRVGRWETQFRVSAAKTTGTCNATTALTVSVQLHTTKIMVRA